MLSSLNNIELLYIYHDFLSFSMQLTYIIFNLARNIIGIMNSYSERTG